MSQGLDDGLLAIHARFGIAAGGGAAAGDSAQAAALQAGQAAAGLLGVPCRKRPVTPFNLPPGLLTATAVGSYLDLPYMFGPQPGWYWDVTALSAAGFTAGALAVTKNFPLVTAAGNPYGIEAVGSFGQAGVIAFPQHGMPLLDSTERLVFTVTAALTGYAQISGQVIQVPAERIDEYLS